MSISVIVPVFNEEAILPAFLSQTDNWPVTEIIIVDGNSTDQTQTLIRLAPRHRLIVAKRGRGNQMNEGARVATSDVLLFLHVDTIFPPDGFSAISKAMQNNHLVGGAFRLKIDTDSLLLKWITRVANIRSTLLALPYGDQGFFVRREVFNKIGGYHDFPLMEDVAFIQRLKQEGKITLLDQAITTSARRYNKQGTIITAVRNSILLLLYFMRVSPKQLAKWY